ncbi:hypothetical protein HanIR_Chr08g0361621 [Helianthus annuus]|nr:hypothetical protein HanIR_Chr08g0361621 [Helianthus annuus]
MESQASILKARKLDERGSLKKRSLIDRKSNESSKTDPRGFSSRKRKTRRYEIDCGNIQGGDC